MSPPFGLSGKDNIFMGNIDEKRLSGLLERIGNMKAELDALENEVRALGEITDLAGETAEPAEVPVAEPVEVAVPTEVSSTPIDDAPIEIDIQDIDIPPIVEDPAAEYTVASVVGEPSRTTGSATENIPIPEPRAQVAEPTFPTSEPDSPVTEPVEATTESKTPASEPVEVTTPATEPATEIENPVAEPVEAISERPESPITQSVETATDPATEPIEAAVPSESQPMDDLPFGDDLPMETEDEPLFQTDEAELPHKPRKAIVDSTKAETAVMDVMADNQAWRTDRPGLQVKNVISAISLNDRVLLINVLFKEDPLLFQNTISAFNAMTTLDEAVAYIQTNFPEWDLNSEPVYRLMMAVRRKLR